MKELFKKIFAVTSIMILGVLLIFSFCNAENSSAQKGDVSYTCPMQEHADVVSDKPGKCPKCGMDLVAKKISVTKYVCPMKADKDVVMDKPGKCHKCGMGLVPMKEEKK